MRFEISKDDVGLRFDKIVAARLRGIGRTAVKRLFVEGKIKIFEPSDAGPEPIADAGENRGRRASKGDVGALGQVVAVDIEAVDCAATPDPEAPLEVAFETDQLLVLEKPAGQPTAPLTPGEKGALANALLARYPEVASCGFSSREPGICHRLDTDTSGLVLAARNKTAFETLTTALREGRLDKRYWLIVPSAGLPESGSIEIPIAPHPKDRRRVLPCAHPRDVARNSPRPASTTWTRLKVVGDLALVEAKAPKALRHQVRAHFAAIGYPLVGDALYGGDLGRGLGRHALHAQRIAWGGDATVPAFVVTSPLPAPLGALLGEGAP